MTTKAISLILAHAELESSRPQSITMLADDTRDYLLTKPASSEETPFGPDVLVYKVGGKMFATLTLEDDIGRTNLKCDPQRAINLRLDHPQILPGYHMNKKHWNTLVLDGSLKPSLVRELIDHSYQLVVSSLPKKIRDSFA